MRYKPTALMLATVAILAAHPLGNFSVNRYIRFDAAPAGVEMTYAIDLAEIPTFQLLQEWQLTSNSPRPELQRRAAEQARAWTRHLDIRLDGQPVQPAFESADFVIADGAGNLPVLRITSKLKLHAKPGKLTYEDHNFEGRAGWKEIVIRASQARLISASQGAVDRSQALTAYPADPLSAPPQDLRAEFEWMAEVPVTTSQAPILRPIPQPASKPAPPPAAMTAKSAPAGSVVRNDFLSRLLRRDQIPLNMILVAIAVAFVLGAAHALTPGHGKTIVAAYLVGSRGTMKHAALLGAMVTFTHTISVFLLGLATLFLFRFIVPENIAEILGVASGLSIFLLGAWMLIQRFRKRTAHSHHHHHDHHHHHAGHHHHDHEHHHHDHAHDHHHEHDHSHLPPDQITWGSLITLAVSGGMVPCESALVLLLSAIAVGRVGLGLILLVAFSLGLAGVLMALGMAVLYAKRAMPLTASHSHSPFVKWVPIGSAAVVTLIGLVMTGVSLNWLPARWLVG